MDAFNLVDKELPHFERSEQKVYWKDDGPTNFVQESLQPDVTMPRAKVEVEQGTIVVFSNYENLHRVLRMQTPKRRSGDGRRV